MDAFRIDPESPVDDLFVGRQTELDILGRELIGPAARAVWISGPAGMGKTSLAMMFAASRRDSFPAGVFNLHATPFEPLTKTVERSVPHDPRPLLLIVNEAESRPARDIAGEVEVVRQIYPSARVVLTSRAALVAGGADLQLTLSGLSQAEFHELLRRRLAYSGSAELADELYTSLMGHPLAARLATDLLREGGLTPRELLERLHAFTWPGIVGPHGEAIREETPEHRHVVSDVVTISDEFLRKLHANPRLLHELSPQGFEELVAELLGRLEYEVTLTPASKDGGKDLYAAKKDHLGTFLFIVECKKYAPDRPVGVGLVRQLNGVVQAEQATAGILATTSFFTKGAKEFQKMISYQISLKDYLGIQDWLEAVLKRGAAEQRHAADSATRRR